ncbi:TerB family tellurite resistance protein [Floridanema evergladense]|uniref:TerB family tellurite resistance protein n=1 Tax=Floridaenema evergladense BLCC-F167 TaxID=3153639 RepID=A0ABV4WWN4_9CYAN
MPILFPFVIPIQFIFTVLATIFGLLVPILTEVIKFTVTRIPKIPTYIRLLKILYSDTDPSSKERKILTAGLLVIGSILTFMAYGVVPLTAVPLIGAITSPIAAALTFAVALGVLDIIFAMNKDYYLQKLKRAGFSVEDITADIKSLKGIFGKSWEKVTTTINEATQKIFEEGSKKHINFNDKSFEKNLEYELEGLTIYLNKRAVTDYENVSADLLNQSDDWTKEAVYAGTGATLGTLTGVGTSAVASSVFVQASVWTTIQGFLGMSTGGIVVGASAYTLLTVATPIGLGVLATIGVYSGLKNWSSEEQAAKKSRFLADIIIAALPMAWIDGELTYQEVDTIDRLITTSGIRKEEQKKVYKARDKHQSFDEIMQAGIPFDQEYREKNCSQSDDERLKHCLILCAAWTIAIADRVIDSSELFLHNRMADKLGISREEVKEIRRMLNPRYIEPAYY